MEKRTSGCLTIFGVTFLVVSLFLNGVLVLGHLARASSGGSGTTHLKAAEDFEEVLINGDGSQSDTIAIVAMNGVISSDIPGQNYGSMVEDIIEKLRQARMDASVKAVIVRIDSPGGEVNASDILYHEVSKTRAVKPVLVYMESVAASGGYYAAMGATHLMANDLTITGSIGVIMETINYKDLMDKIGVKTVVFKSGKMKDMLNPAREITPEESQFVQDMVLETYEKFVGIVAKERKLDIEMLKKELADGRIFSGKKAAAVKLIDSLGYFEDAISKAREMAQSPNAKVIEYQAPFNFGRIFRFLAEASYATPKVELQLTPQRISLQPGKLYYLSGHLFGRG